MTDICVNDLESLDKQRERSFSESTKDGVQRIGTNFKKNMSKTALNILDTAESGASMVRVASKGLIEFSMDTYHEVRKPKTIVDVHSFSMIALVGGLLNFNAGYINAAVWIAHDTGTTHLTGLVTKSSMAIVRGYFIQFLNLFVRFIIFLIGAFLSSLSLGGNRDKFDVSMRYAFLMMFLGMLLFGAYAAEVKRLSFWVTALVTLSAGIQNAMTTFYSGAVVRTTHVTGTVTDIGIELASLYLGRTKTTWKLKLLSTFLFGFFSGGCCGTIVGLNWKNRALIVPATLSGIICLFCANFVHSKKRKEKRSVSRKELTSSQECKAPC